MSAATVASPKPRSARELPAYRAMHELMRRFRVDGLVGVEPDAFLERVLALSSRDDGDAAGAALQNPVAVRFAWGHRHDFGTFCMPGRMGNHHIAVLATLVDELRVLPARLDGRRVLDVGCWTGGTCLLLAAMGAEVVGVEEIAMYAEAAAYLARAFGLDRVRVDHASFYECTGDRHRDAYDHVLLAGVLHHLSDPRLALRIAFNCLRDGGTCLIETLSFEHERQRLDVSDAATAPTWGWNALLFEPPRLHRMLESVGFSIEHPCTTVDGRTYVAARRDRHVDLWRGGLSVRHVR